MSDYELHSGAFTDIDEIAIYIELDSIEAAHRVVDEIHSSLQALTAFPIVATAAQTSPAAPCALFGWDYLIAYAPDETLLWVIAVMHGYRSPRVMAAILRGRESSR